MRRCASPFGIIPAEERKENENEVDDNEAEGEKVTREMMVGAESQQQQQGEKGGMEGERLTLTSSMSYRPLEEDPEWSLFLPFDSLEFSFVGGAIGVCRPVPEEVSSTAWGERMKRKLGWVLTLPPLLHHPPSLPSFQRYTSQLLR